MHGSIYLQAALAPSEKKGRVTVNVSVSGTEFILANLIPEKIEQQTLDIVFTEGKVRTEAFSLSFVNNNEDLLPHF
jgi:hypothetical protein